MRKRLILSSCLFIMVCTLQCTRRPVRAGIQPPVWSKGDSWHVKCPFYHGSRSGYKLAGYYTLLVEVLDNETARGWDCYVLKISSRPDFAKRLQGVPRYESYVYYGVRDYAVKRIRTDVWRAGSLEHYDEYAMRGATMFGLEAIYPTMPIVLPQFPLADTGSEMRYHWQFEKVDTPAARADPEYDKRALSTTMNVVSTAGITSRDAGRMACTGSTKGAVTVDFVRTVGYKSDDLTVRQLTEIWAPGHKWWIWARPGDLNTPSSSAYYLDGGPLVPRK